MFRDCETVTDTCMSNPNEGTGGTIAGVSSALKARSRSVRVFLVDPPGSGLYNKVTRGVMFTKQEAEQKRLKNPFDTITEGVGINRVTENFARWEWWPKDFFSRWPKYCQSNRTFMLAPYGMWYFDRQTMTRQTELWNELMELHSHPQSLLFLGLNEEGMQPIQWTRVIYHASWFATIHLICGLISCYACVAASLQELCLP